MWLLNITNCPVKCNILYDLCVIVSCTLYFWWFIMFCCNGVSYYKFMHCNLLGSSRDMRNTVGCYDTCRSWQGMLSQTWTYRILCLWLTCEIQCGVAHGSMWIFNSHVLMYCLWQCWCMIGEYTCSSYKCYFLHGAHSFGQPPSWGCSHLVLLIWLSWLKQCI